MRLARGAEQDAGIPITIDELSALPAIEMIPALRRLQAADYRAPVGQRPIGRSDSGAVAEACRARS